MRRLPRRDGGSPRDGGVGVCPAPSNPAHLRPGHPAGARLPRGGAGGSGRGAPSRGARAGTGVRGAPRGGVARALTAAPRPRVPPAAHSAAPGLAGQGAPPELRGPGETSFTLDFSDNFPPPPAPPPPHRAPRPPPSPRVCPPPLRLRAAPRRGRGGPRGAERRGGQGAEARRGRGLPVRPPWAARWHRRSGRAALLWGRGLSEGTHRGPARPMALRLTTRGAVRGDVRRPLIGCGGAAAEPAGRGARGAGPPRSPRAIAAASPAPPGLPRSGPGSAALRGPAGGTCRTCRPARRCRAGSGIPGLRRPARNPPLSAASGPAVRQERRG